MSKVNKNPIKISNRAWDWLKDEQYNRRKATGIEPSFADLIDEYLFHVPKTEQNNAPNSTSAPPVYMLPSVHSAKLPPPLNIPQEHQQWVARLLYILKHNFPKAVRAIHSNLIAFEALTELGVDNAPPPSDPDPEKEAKEALDNAYRQIDAAKELTDRDKRTRRPGDKTA